MSALHMLLPLKGPETLKFLPPFCNFLPVITLDSPNRSLVQLTRRFLISETAAKDSRPLIPSGVRFLGSRKFPFAQVLLQLLPKDFPFFSCTPPCSYYSSSLDPPLAKLYLLLPFDTSEALEKVVPVPVSLPFPVPNLLKGIPRRVSTRFALMRLSRQHPPVA